MADQAPTRCPQCGGPLQVAALHCPQCDLTMSGEFGRCRFCDIPPDQQAFLEVFVRCRGVIRQMEKALGISYPTVRARMDDLLRALGFAGDATGAGPQSVREVLAQLEQGQISAQDAIQRIRQAKGRP